MSNREIKERRQKLIAKGLGCHWCGRPVKEYENKGSNPPDDQATIDHLFDKYNPHRKTPNHNQERRWVLSCYRCNNDRNKLRQQQLPKELLTSLKEMGVQRTRDKKANRVRWQLREKSDGFYYWQHYKGYWIKTITNREPGTVSRPDAYKSLNEAKQGATIHV